MDQKQPMITTPLRTTFGSIREYAPDDLDALVRYADNRKIWQNMRDAFPSPYTRESGLAFLAAVRGQHPTTFFAIASAQELIGGIGISLNHDVHRLTAEMGYWLGEPFWGKGIISESIRVFSEYAFQRFSLVRIYAEPYQDNLASSRALEKAGYRLEGRMEKSAIKEGRLLDQLLYAKVVPPSA
jgi:[ribosomal protein S5]-alanine N-acetyltransferase